MRDYTREILIAGANQVNLSPSKTQRLLQFVENWIALNPKDSQRPSFDTNYAETWANRFKKIKRICICCRRCVIRFSANRWRKKGANDLHGSINRSLWSQTRCRRTACNTRYK